MLRKILLAGLLCLIATPAVMAAEHPDKSKLPPLPDPYAGLSEYAAGEVLVKYRSNFTQQDMKTFNKQVQASAVDKVQAQAAFHAFHNTRTKRKMLLPGWEVVKLPAGKSVAAAIAEMKGNALIEYVEPNGKAHAAALSTTYTPTGAFNDNLYVDGFSQWWVNRTRADVAANAGICFGTSSDVIVAVLDTGVMSSHSEFVGRLVPGLNFDSEDTVNYNTNYIEDDNINFGGRQIQGHGTHVAGMIAANVNNTFAIAGSAWDTRVKIMPVKVLDEFAAGWQSDIADGISWATNNGAHVINMSLTAWDDSTPIRNAVTNAYNSGNGALLVAAAGNGNSNMANANGILYPACYAEVMSIGATSSMDTVTYYSNYCSPYNADRLDCVAPGGAVIVYSAGFPEDNGVTSTARTGGFSTVDGTSFSAPQVAALGAMIKLAWPNMTAYQIRSRILTNCDSVDGGNPAYVGQGRINFMKALSLFPTPTVTPTVSVTITPSPTRTRQATATCTPIVKSKDVFRAYPQPGREFVRVAFLTQGFAKVKLELFNATGEKVLFTETQATDLGGYGVIELKTKELGQGVYYVKLKVDDASGSRSIKGKIAVVH